MTCEQNFFFFYHTTNFASFFSQADNPDKSYLEEEEEAINDTPATTAYMYPNRLQEKRSESNQGQGSSIAHSTGTNLRV